MFLGGTRVILLCLELGFVWLVYFAYGVVSAHEMPVWMTTTLVIFVDRAASSITSIAETQRQQDTPFAPLMRFSRRVALCGALTADPLRCFEPRAHCVKAESKATPRVHAFRSADVSM